MVIIQTTRQQSTIHIYLYILIKIHVFTNQKKKNPIVRIMDELIGEDHNSYILTLQKVKSHTT